jgi:hypothetical protein
VIHEIKKYEVYCDSCGRYEITERDCVLRENEIPFVGWKVAVRYGGWGVRTYIQLCSECTIPKDYEEYS